MSEPTELQRVFERALSRRKLLEASALGLAALILPGCGGGGGGTSGGTIGGTTTAGTSTGGGTTGGATTGGGTTGGSTTGGAACTTNGNTLVLSLAQNPQLQQVGGLISSSDSRYTDPVCGNDGFIVAQSAQGKFVAFSSSCTHFCCSVQQQGSQLFCPCHGSTFDLNGNVTRGPAAQALPSIPTCFDGSNVYVQLA